MIPAIELKKYSLFSRLSLPALEEISAGIEQVEVKAGEIIIKQNTPPDYYFIIKNGEVEVTRRNTFGQNAKITHLNRGEGFGEMAILMMSHRNNNVVALTDVSLYRIDRVLFERVKLMDTAFRELMEEKVESYIEYNNLKTLQPFALLDPEKMIALSKKFLRKKCRTGEVVLKEGESGDYYYVIQNGEFAVDRGGSEIDRLRKGQGFGEEAILRDKKRNASVRALVDSDLLALHRDDFNQILKQSFLSYTFPEDITEDERKKFVFIDARVPEEYEEEHIEGALNIPLEILRQKFAELDPGEKYITYCTHESRGMAAAFILQSQGFQAQGLRSGLSGWEGPIASRSRGIYYPAAE